jgi:small subunit ribosomal protein S16
MSSVSLLIGFGSILNLDIAHNILGSADHSPGQVRLQEFYVIKLRLRRTGAKKRPSYRIVAAESKSPRDGRFIEIIGHYDPLTEPATVKVDEERARHWLSVGAQPTETVAGLLKRAGVIATEPKAEAAPADAS